MIGECLVFPLILLNLMSGQDLTVFVSRGTSSNCNATTVLRELLILVKHFRVVLIDLRTSERFTYIECAVYIETRPTIRTPRDVHCF